MKQTPSAEGQVARRIDAVGPLVTVSLIVVPAAAFTALFRIPIDQKPLFFVEMIAGPYAGLFSDTRFGFEPLTAICVTLMTLPFVVWPRWLTLIPTLLGAFCWFGCGVVAATGGV